MKKNKVFISLGSNLGNRAENLKRAIHGIELNIGPIFRLSSVYETKPWGNNDQPDFLNQVIWVYSEKPPINCLQSLSLIEEQMGRKRSGKWDARMIDLDLLYVDDIVIQSEKLTLPHPGIALRRFVLIPLVEIDPHFIHPQLLLSQKELLRVCPDVLEVKVLQA